MAYVCDRVSESRLVLMEGATHTTDVCRDLWWRRDLILAVKLGDLLVVRA